MAKCEKCGIEVASQRTCMNLGDYKFAKIVRSRVPLLHPSLVVRSSLSCEY